MNRKTKKTSWHLYGVYHNKRPSPKPSELLCKALATLDTFFKDPSTQKLLEQEAKENDCMCLRHL